MNCNELLAESCLETGFHRISYTESPMKKKHNSYIQHWFLRFPATSAVSAIARGGRLGWAAAMLCLLSCLLMAGKSMNIQDAK